MDFGSEISKKIKAAIKTKLQDLGSYVDDELPEYIMVMLGNKRSKEQMTEDLMLFLGDNTVIFIEWLLNLVDKLKDVTSLIDSLPSDNTMVQVMPDDTLNGNKVESKPEQNTKKVETRDKKKSPKSTSKEYSQPKSEKSDHSKSEKSKVSSIVSKNAHRKRKMSESDEEETPLKTQMPSVVKVRDKRPSLPPSKQATSSLLKRAVAEAHLSVTKMNPSHSHTYDPTSPPSPIKVHSIEEKRQQKELLLQQHRELQKQLNEEQLDETIEEPSRTDDYENTVQDKEVNEAGVKPFASDSSTVPSSNPEAENEPLIELQVSEAEALEYSSEAVKGDTRIVAFADGHSVNDAEEDKHKRRRKRAVKSRDRPQSPKFIVTLDGVDSDLEDKYEKSSKKSRHKKQKTEFDDYIEVDTSNMVTTQAAPPAPEKPEYMPPAIEQVMFRVDPNSDDEEMQQFPVPSKQPEKCKFWPDCSNGAKCPFYHPTAPCRTFPNCKFADKCMFIHPLCKFDGRCTNVSCPFAHKLKTKLRNPVAAPTTVIEPKIDDSLPALPQLTPCKFFPGCTRSNCPFLHPKPNAAKVCRYGAACSRIDCKFSHPPSKAALKWVSPSLHLSERAFALPAESVTKMPVAS